MNQQNQFDYSGLTPPESMGGRSAAPVNPPRATRPIPPAATPTPAPPPPTTPVPSASPAQPAAPVPTSKPSDDLILPGDNPPRPPAGGQMQMPRSSGGSWFLIMILVILLILAVLVFLSWEGWISLGGVEKLWGGGKSTPTPVATISPEETPVLTNDIIRKEDLASIQLALQKYFADTGGYPESNGTTKTSDSTSLLAQALVPAYLPRLPDDPIAPQYYYGYRSDGQSFQLTCVLEDKTDASGVLNGSLNIYTVTNSSGQ